MRTLWKSLALVLLTVVSMQVSISHIQSYLATATAKEKTMAELLVQQQMQAQLDAAAKEVEAELEELDLVIEQQEVTIKPPVVEVELQPEPEPESAPEVEEETPTPEVAVEVEPTQEEPATVEELPAYLAPKPLEEIDDVEGYLIEAYFLNGYDYAEMETDPTLKAQKELACAMENYTIDTIDGLVGLTDVLSNLDKTQALAILAEMVSLQETFQETYSYLEPDAQFGPIYQATMAYFDQAIVLCNIAVSLLEDVEASTNVFLALSMLLKAVDTDLMPQVDVVLDCVFEMKELTNAVYLQGCDEAVLTKEDAKALVQELETMIFTW